MENNIIEKYSKVVKNLARKYSTDLELQNDLCQEGYLCLIIAKKNYSPDMNVDFITYAFPYVKYNMLRYYKKNKENSFEKLSEKEISKNNEIDNICFDNIESLINECSPECQKIISLIINNGLTIREIAAKLKYSKSKVSYILSKEKDKLYKKIKNVKE